jgi:thioredoxin
MKYLIRILPLFALVLILSCNQNTQKEKSIQPVNDQSVSASNVASEDIKPEYLTAQTFREKVWDYQANPDQWVYSGDLPCVVDFYADWCKPCKMVAPIMDELADHYKGRVVIYKVNTDKERELASVFQVSSIPSILFAPVDGKPALQPGALSKEDYISIIDEFILKINKKENNKKENNKKQS